MRRPFLTISISGASSSGKSTLAYQVQALFSPHVPFLLQLDDFCKEEEDLPVRPNGLPDADAVDSVDFPAFKSALLHCKHTGELPADFKSWQDPEDVAEAKRRAVVAIGETKMQEARKRLNMLGMERDVGIVEGFLLYQDRVIREMLDVKLFLRTSEGVAKARQMKRPGYGDPNTKDFWRMDGYFEECVWANYVKENGWLFEGMDVEGRLNEEVCRRERILVQPRTDRNREEETFDWAVTTLCEALAAMNG
ncbi:ribosylnicotinamide kinase [Trapelia coarctata]|nr:ribosylnicotinamide kinase [Trapelia coarctata]